MDLQYKTIGLVVNAPEFFERPDFMAWLNSRCNRVFSYHRGGAPDDHSDVIVMVDSAYEGDSSDMPDDIWRAICDIVYKTYCGGAPKLWPVTNSRITVRLTNLDN